MCGRFAQTIPLGRLNKTDIFDLSEEEYLENFNLAPGQSASVIVFNGKNRILKRMKWGLIPSWVTDIKNFKGLINARYETINVKPSFKSSFKTRRCIIPASGYYEWEKRGKEKKPYFINHGCDDDGVFNPVFLCGLYDINHSAGNKPLETFTIVTTNSSVELSAIHYRMPLIVNRSGYDIWLMSEFYEDIHTDFMKFKSISSLKYYPVSDYVNLTSNNSEMCIIKQTS